MAEIVSEYVMDWARDLEASRKMLTSEQLQLPMSNQVVVVRFAEYRLQQSSSATRDDKSGNR